MSKKASSSFHYFLTFILLLSCLLYLFLNNGFIHYIIGISSFFGIRWALRKWTGFRSSGWIIFQSIVIILFFSIFSFLCTLVKSSTNYIFFFDQKEQLSILQSGNWVSLSEANSIDKDEEFSNSNVSIQTVYIQRPQPSIFGKIKNLVKKEQIRIYTFSPRNEFYLIADVSNNLAPMTHYEAMARKKSDFLINASFYDTQNNALGEIIYLGKKFQNKSSSTGYFKVIDGVPHAGPTSIFENDTSMPYYSCQAHPSTMKDGIIFSYIENESNLNHNQWGQKSYRNLIGENKKGEIVFVVSNKGAILTVKEISQIAKLVGVQNAALFDAGIALQYEFNHPDFKESYSAFNNHLDAGKVCDELCMELFRKNFIQRSPVYIGVKLKDDK